MADATLAQRVRRRRVERHGAAIVRALSGHIDAEFRGHRLRLAGTSLPFAAPWLLADPGEGSVERNRGVADGLGVRLRFSDFALHRSLEPEAPFARVVFDILEQLRCEALVPVEYPGVQANLDVAFMDWAHEAELYEVGESALGLLLYTLTHMARSRVVRPLQDEQIESTIEVTRSHIGVAIGEPLHRLRFELGDQAAYAALALAIAALIDEIAGHPEDDPRSGSTVASRTGLTIPAAFSESDGPLENHPDAGLTGQHWSVDDGQELDQLGGYHVFTREYDRELSGADLFPTERLRRLRSALDRQVAAQSVSIPGLALRLQRLLGRPVDDGWQPLQDEGILDPARLGQIVASPTFRHAFRQPRPRPTSPAVVTFLVDQSGSMKRQRFETVAVLLDTFCRALDLAGAKSEVLGFTTGDWNGGRTLTDWRHAGAPAEPGRLAELAHIIYKDADHPWRRSRAGIAAMADSRWFREGVDGEALSWAYSRLLSRPEPRRLLVLISDGSPYDAASGNNNRPGFLDDHIVAVARRIERDERVELGAVSLDLDMASYVTRSIAVDLSGTLGLRNYRLLDDLFAARSW